MPPKKPPSQAGKFKPLKRPAKKSSGDAAPAAAASSSSAPSGGGRGGRTPPRERLDGGGRGGGGRAPRTSLGRGSEDGRGRGREGGRGRGGRGGRGGRAGRFIVPTGQAFFTGEAAKRAEASGPTVAGSSGFGGGPSQETRVQAGTDGAVFMPGMPKEGGTSASSSDNRVARSAAESMAMAARAKAGEGEEIIVAEMMDLDGDDENDGEKKKSVLDGPSNSRFDGMPSLFDDEDKTEEIPDHGGISDAYLYDSDSSAEERRDVRRRKDTGGGFRMPPTQLPFPTAPHQQSMYDCQEVKDEEEKKLSDGDAIAATTTTASSKLSDPPLQSPFLDLRSVSDHLKQLETNSWFLMKFPTRLPHLDTSSSANASERAALIKSELSSEDVIGKPDAVGSSNVDAKPSGEVGSMASSSSAAGAAAASTSSGAQGYDDTLKDTAAGRYGRIVVRKSGKTELIIDGGEDGPEVRLLVHEGLQCGFRQEAVCIDPEESTFVSLGCVDKSLIMTPDIERAFVFS